MDNSDSCSDSNFEHLTWTRRQNIVVTRLTIKLHLNVRGAMRDVGLIPVQWVEHVDHFHGTAAGWNVGESNDVAEEDRDAVILLGLDLVVRDLELDLHTINFSFFDLDYNLHFRDLFVYDALELLGLDLAVHLELFCDLLRQHLTEQRVSTSLLRS